LALSTDDAATYDVNVNYNSTIRAPRQIGRTGGDRVFRAAARHSRFVRFLRFAIPAGIVAIVAILLASTFFNPSRLFPSFPIDPGKVSLSGTKIVMESPRVSGFSRDSQRYEVTARTATQDLTKPDILDLKDVNAEVELKDGQHITITSPNGVYDTKGELLRLNDHITANSTSGYEARLSEATVNTASGNIVSESPVEVKLPNNGLVNANHLEVMENGASILFGGGVETTVNPDQIRPDPQDSPPLGAPTRTGAALQAQQSNGPPNALQGFSQNRGKPIKITSATLEVRDKDKMATFSGDVHLVQGDTTMRSKTLVVFYDDDGPAKSTPGPTGPQQNQQIKRVEAKSDVIVVQKDQTATGESGIFDMKSNTATLIGNVVISQGANVVRGDTLTVDLTTGVSHIACGTAQVKCRVHSSFQQESTKPEGRGQQAVPTRPRSSQPQAPASQPKGLY
jgi:lipopolysaccharide export system protein LptA